MRPYVGVTGFTKPSEVAAVLAALPAAPSRALMVGVLASWKSLREIPLKPQWQKQFPPPPVIHQLFLGDPRVVNLVHYSMEEGQEHFLSDDLSRIHDLAGSSCHGFQLNVPWPSAYALDTYRKTVGTTTRIVLQIGQRALVVCGGLPDVVANCLGHYVGTIDDVLLDPSGGRGHPLEPVSAHAFLGAIADRQWSFGLGVAGGLGPDTLDCVAPLVEEFPNLSIDAQGRLRTTDNDLDIDAATRYVAKALEMFAPTLRSL